MSQAWGQMPVLLPEGSWVQDCPSYIANSRLDWEATVSKRRWREKRRRGGDRGGIRRAERRGGRVEGRGEGRKRGGYVKHSSPKIQSAKSSRVYYGLELVKEMRQEGKSSMCHWPLGHIYSWLSKIYYFHRKVDTTPNHEVLVKECWRAWTSAEWRDGGTGCGSVLSGNRIVPCHRDSPVSTAIPQLRLCFPHFNYPQLTRSNILNRSLSGNS